MATSRPTNRHSSALDAFFRCIFVIASLMLLVSCQKSDIRYAQTLDRNDLMVLPFPDWAPTETAKVQAVDLSATTNARQKSDATAIRAEITPLYVVKLDEQHAALVTQVLRVGDDGIPDQCHACSGEIGAYFFERGAAGWRMTSRQDSVAVSGVNGELGRTAITKLEDGHFVVTADWGSCWQGYCGSGLVVVGLVPGRATDLTEKGDIALTVDNDGAYGACEALDKPKPADPGDVEGDRECLDIRSKWKFQGKRLVISFEGRLSQLDKDGQLKPTQKIQQQAVYEIAPGKLTLISGSNPIPAF